MLLFWIVCFAGIAAAIVIAVVMLWPVSNAIAAHDVRGIPANERPEQLRIAFGSARGMMIQIGAGLLATGAFVYTARNFTLARQAHQLSEQGQVTDRYSKAIDQLGSDKVDVRIGGIYALERIATDSARDREVIIEVLAAFIRRTADRADSLPDHRPQADIKAAMIVIAGRKHSASLGQFDLKNVDLRGIRLAAVQLTGAVLAGAVLDGADLTKANLTDAVLDGADLTKANLTDAVLHGADLTKANLTDAVLHGADLTKANLTDAVLADAILVDADLSDADLSRAGLPQADLHRAKLVAANLSGADLAGADFTSAVLSRSDMTRAKLKGAIFADATLSGTIFVGADMTGVDLATLKLAGLDLTGARLDPSAWLPSGWQFERPGRPVLKRAE